MGYGKKCKAIGIKRDLTAAAIVRVQTFVVPRLTDVGAVFSWCGD
jgi:hypothetical protein